MSDPFGRLRLLLGDDGLARLEQARVAVFGLGAVGSFAVEALARSAIGRLRLVDFDQVQQSNRNRQILALSGTVGRPKVDVAKERVLAINPAAQVDARAAFFDADTAEELLAGPLDFVIDAIDSLGPKVTLIHAAVARALPLVTALGAANRSDPTRLRITDIGETHTCPLARKVRQRLHRLGVRSGVTAIWSTEPLRGTPLPPDDHDAVEETVLARGRPRAALPSSCALPGIVGLMAANHVVWSLADPASAARRLDNGPGDQPNHGRR